MDCDLIVVITEPDDIIASTIEVITVVEVEIPAEPSSYTINFDTDETDTWGVYSKFNGNITSAELTNIDSYLIDGVSVSLPFEVELNKTYLIEVIKTNPALEASILFNTDYIQFDEVQDLPDFSIGDGRWLYGLGDTTNVNTLYRWDSNLLISSNYSGAGTWTVNPLINTITLPTLPINGYWSKCTFIKTGHILISGGNTGNYDKYFCYVSALTGTLDDITDLNGSASAYTTILSSRSGYPITDMYDYINNKIYITASSAASDFNVLDLDTQTITKIDNNFGYYLTGIKSLNKIQFNPYKNAFSSIYEANFINNTSVRKIGSAECYNSRFSKNLNRYILPYYTDGRTIYVCDTYSGIPDSIFSASGGAGGANTQISYDNENDIITTYSSWSSGPYSFAIFHLLTNKKKAFNFVNPEPAQNSIIDSCVSNYSGMHFAISFLMGRLQIIDATSDPEVTIQPDFGYLDFAGKVWSITTNQII